jgi:uncharacterized coiled-coil protein SlyX
MQMLADVAPTIKEGSGEGSWITTGFVAAIFAGIAGVLVAYRKGQAHGVEIKNQPVKVEQTPGVVTWQEVRDLKDRVRDIERRMDELKESQGKQFQMIMSHQHASELRVMEKLDDVVRPLHERIDALLGLMQKKKARGTRPNIE